MRPDFPFRPASLPFFYGWVVLFVSTLGIVMSVPGQTMGVSVFTDHLIEATGLDRLQISNAYLLGTIVSGLLLPFGGSLADRIGGRRMALLATSGLGVMLVFLALCDRLSAAVATAAGTEGRGLPFVTFALLSVGFTGIRFFGQGMLTLVSRNMLARWWEARRGLMSGLSGPFVNFSFALAPLVLSAWIARAGWRGAWIEMAAVVVLGMGAIGWLLFRDTPEECGLRMDGRPAPTGGEAQGADVPHTSREEPAFTRSEALRTAAFWLVTFAMGSQALVGTALTFHIVDLGAEAGLSESAAVAIFLPIAMVTVPVGFLAGAAIDRYPIRYLIAVAMAAQCFMFVGMAHQDVAWMRAMAIAGWGVAGGFFGPLMTAAMPTFFGRKHLGAIQGALMMGLVIASALGPSALAAFKAGFGSYAPGLYVLTSLPVAVLLAAPFVRNPVASGSSRLPTEGDA
ncbi:MAG: MFS transporter [Myxococcota bacterium]|nr:MFS transporter [Myxococcota bacterium]